VRWPSFAAGTTLTILFGLALVQIIAHPLLLAYQYQPVGARGSSAYPLLNAYNRLDCVGTFVILFNGTNG